MSELRFIIKDSSDNPSGVVYMDDSLVRTFDGETPAKLEQRRWSLKPSFILDQYNTYRLFEFLIDLEPVEPAIKAPETLSRTKMKIYTTTSDGRAVVLGEVILDQDLIQDTVTKIILEPARDQTTDERVMYAEILRPGGV